MLPMNAILTILPVLVLSSRDAEAQELMSYGVNDFDNNETQPTLCCPNCSDLWYSCGMAEVVHDELEAAFGDEDLLYPFSRRVG